MSADTRHTVLVVDDEEAILLLIQRQLQNLPYLIVPTSSAAEAVHILESREVAMLICDLKMPQMEGTDVLLKARESNPNIVPIILTGYADAQSAIKAINECGVWKYITKPWDHKELFKIVQEGVARYEMLCKQQAQLTKLAQDITAREEKTGQAIRITTRVKSAPKKVLHFFKVRKVDRHAAANTVHDSGETIGGRYRIQAVIGEGGMGTVYKAEDELLGMPVAIKALKSQYTRDSHAVTNLKEEARIAMQLSHRHIVRLHNLQQAGEHFFLVMEYVDGRTFREVLNLYGTLPLATVRQVLQVCSDALSYAHRHEVLHRDLKPANLLLTKDGVLKIIDFGVACLMSSQKDDSHIMGTPIYMSPEQIRGETLDGRTDIYSLGVILYELLTGAPPFPKGTTDLDLLMKGPAELPNLPPEIHDVMRKALAPKRKERWNTLEDFARAMMDSAH